MSSKIEPHGALTIRTLAMPADTNPAGDIFGGWVLSQMDIAGAIAAVERARGRVATVAIDAMTFIAPVKVGDILCVYTEIVSTGTTSITVEVEAWARRTFIDTNRMRTAIERLDTISRSRTAVGSGMTMTATTTTTAPGRTTCPSRLRCN